MEFISPIGLKEIIKPASYLTGSILFLLMLPGCGRTETALATSDGYGIKDYLPGQTVTICNCEIGIESSINRRSNPLIFPPDIARSVGDNIAYTNVEETIKYPIIEEYPTAKYRSTSETDWIPYLSPKSGKQVFVIINGETIDRLRGYNPHLLKKVNITDVKTVRGEGKEKVLITANKDGMQILISQSEIDK